MKLVGLVSTYLEGTLSRAAVESIRRCDLDDLLVWEGAAGEPIEADVPESEFPEGTKVQTGRWRTDGRKRDAMLQEAKQRNPERETWALVVDGDEVLGNGEYVRDLVQMLLWSDELHRAEDAEAEPWARWPLRIVEADGAIASVGGRLFRLDLVTRVVHSTSVVENVHGVTDGWGNVTEDSQLWIKHFLGAIDHGRMTAWPPLPCEPYLVHRSHLRHPLRRGKRMHAQENAEFRKAGILK